MINLFALLTLKLIEQWLNLRTTQLTTKPERPTETVLKTKDLQVPIFKRC